MPDLELRQDLRYGLRQLARNPGFTAVAVLTLALGVGANTLAFSLLYGSLFRRLPFPEPDRLFLLQVERRGTDQSMERFQWTYRQFRWMASQPLPVTSIAEFSGPAGVNLSGGGDPERLRSEVVSATYFATLGVASVMGRTFLPEEHATPGTHPVALIGHGLWRRRFAQDPGVVGQTIRLNGVPLEIVGVMPEGFGGVTGQAEVWIPDMMAPQVTFDRFLTSNDTFHTLIARTRPGVMAGGLRAALDPLGPRLAEADPTAETLEGATALRVIFRPLVEVGIDPARRRSAVLLFGTVWLVLAVACVNLAGLELARARVRARELAVRTALGAGRGRLVRQLVTEGALLGLLGCALGLALALPGAALLRRIEPVRSPNWGNLYTAVSQFASIELHPQVLLFALLVSFATVLLVSLVPALRAARPGIVQDLRQGTPGDTGAGWSLRRPGVLAWLTVAEVALALVLAVGAGLLLKSFQRAQQGSFGFDPTNVITFRIDPPDPTFSIRDAPARITPVLEAVQRIPGVEAASVSMCTPFMGCGRHQVYVVGQGAQGSVVGVLYVGPDHFKTLRIPMLRGRIFTPADRAGAPRVIIINRAAAERFFPGRDPIGQRVVWDDARWLSVPDSAWQIVGVVENVTYWPVEEPPRPDFYFSYLQHTYPNTIVIARTRVPPAAIIPQLRAAVATADPDLPVDQLLTMQERMGQAWSGRRFVAYVLGGFAMLAFALAGIGVYGVASYSVSQRAREMGIRQALGAAPQDVFRLVVIEGAVLCAAGLAVGVVMALAATRVLRAFLFSVSPTDPLTFLTVTVTIGIAAVLATVAPARRATRAEPVVCLRAE